MLKVLSFSLWGDNPTYNIGAIRNAEDALTIYPEFKCWFYIHVESVPQTTIDKLKTFSNVKIIYKTGDLNKIKPMMWRFETIDDPNVEIMMSRDTDTRFTTREVLAVHEWLNSDKFFHIMRDHPHHGFCILGGMFGTRKLPDIPSWINVMNTFNQTGNRDYDQSFLRDYIYPIVCNNSIVHASFHKLEPHARNFPINFCNDLRFVGEYVYFDESRSSHHINILRQSI